MGHRGKHGFVSKRYGHDMLNHSALTIKDEHYGRREVSMNGPFQQIENVLHQLH